MEAVCNTPLYQRTWSGMFSECAC